MKVSTNKNKTKIKNMDKDREEFLKDVGTTKEMREHIKMYKDPKAIEELNKQMDNLGIDEKDYQELNSPNNFQCTYFLKIFTYFNFLPF